MNAFSWFIYEKKQAAGYAKSGHPKHTLIIRFWVVLNLPQGDSILINHAPWTCCAPARSPTKAFMCDPFWKFGLAPTCIFTWQVCRLLKIMTQLNNILHLTCEVCRTLPCPMVNDNHSWTPRISTCPWYTFLEVRLNRCALWHWYGWWVSDHLRGDSETFF